MDAVASRRRWSRLLVAGVVIALLALPQVGGRFWQYLTLNILLLSLFSLSFNLLFGMTGLLSFGQAAFYATGAYATALLLRTEVIPLLPSVIMGTVVAALLAALIGFFCVRHTHVYFAMLTLAFGMMVYAIVWKWTPVTGGDDGLIGIPRGSLSIPGLFTIRMGPLAHYYYFLTVLALLGIYALYRISRSPFGLVLNGMRENAGRVEFAGIPMRRYLWWAFTIAGSFAGLAGSLMAPLESTVAPASAHWAKSAEPVMASLIGGPFTFAGPIVGSLIYIGLKEVIVRFTQYWLLIFGTGLLALVLGFRGGVVGFLLQRFARRDAPTGPAEG